MAFTVDTTANAQLVSGSSFTISGTVGSGASAMFAFTQCVGSAGNSPISTVVWDAAGVNESFAAPEAELYTAASLYGVAITGLLAPTAKTALVTVTFAGSPSRAAGQFVSVHGGSTTALSNAIATNDGATEAAAPPTISLTTISNNSMVLATFGHRANTTPVPNNTSLFEAGNTPLGDCCGSQYFIDGAASAVTNSWTGTFGTDQKWVACAIEYELAAAPGTTVDSPTSTHTYSAQAPQARASVAPVQVVHTYSAQAPQARASVAPVQVMHTYTGSVPSVLAGIALSAPAMTHTYTGRVPGVAISGGVNPLPVTHTYTAQAAQLQASVQVLPVTHVAAVPVPAASVGARIQPAPVTHTYTAQAPQAQASVQAGVVVHSYTALVPQSISEGAPAVYGWGARGRVGDRSGIDAHERIGSAVATDRFKRIGSDKA